MINNELTTYIRSARSHGDTRAEIHKTLVDQGWDKADVDNALRESYKTSSLWIAGAVIIALLLISGGILAYRHHKSATTSVSIAPTPTPFAENLYAPLDSDEQFITGKVDLGSTPCTSPVVVSGTDSVANGHGRALNADGTFKTVGLTDIITEVDVEQGPLTASGNHPICLHALYIPGSTGQFVINAAANAFADQISNDIGTEAEAQALMATPGYSDYEAWYISQLDGHTFTDLQNNPAFIQTMLGKIQPILAAYSTASASPTPTSGS